MGEQGEGSSRGYVYMELIHIVVQQKRLLLGRKAMTNLDSREGQDGEHMYTMADSRECMAKTTTVL